ncbi:uncharacterized protein LOC109603954 [Aethina tumida]|uniref:uncharacterized protein LOC109603954 n=1 Tax=Aethina tumida TaxID=116153 RepID=UPI002147DA11|nr:uncharacterized protein LOC109603954 [Aethina tumida]
MYLLKVFCGVLVLVCFADNVLATRPPAAIQDPTQIHAEEKKLSDYVLRVLDHYKQEDPIGIPDAPIPDPLDIPPLQSSVSVYNIKMFNSKLYGLKNFRVEHITANIADMTGEAALTIEKLHVKGNYTLTSWFSRAEGPFTVDLSDVFVMATANLEVDRLGQLEAQDMIMDMSFKDISMDFKNLGGLASFLQGVMNSIGTFVFSSIKPFVLGQVSSQMRDDVNKEVKKIPQKFPNSISPFDQLISEARKKVRAMGYDPYKVNDYNTSVGVLDIYMSHTWVYGISSFYRTKDIILEIRNNTLHALVEVGTQKMLGTSHWNFNLVAGMMTRSGTIEFSVDYLKVTLNASQTLDTRNSPNLDDIQIELGNIQVRFDGLGTTDYLVELGINVLPNLLRYQIMDALEKPVKLRIQEVLKTVNVENVIKENRDKIDTEGFNELF